MSAAADLPKPPLPVAAIRALRPKQWVKNGVLLAPLLFAKSIFAQGALVNAMIAVASFSLLASGVYVLNDWFDREKDRLHPEKRKRPIAAGHLGGGAAIGLIILCWAVAGYLGLLLSLEFIQVLAGYLVLQFFYTFALKKMVLLDIMGIALGFILRVVAGAVAIQVVVSNWLFLCTLLGALFLGFAKRRAELSSLEDASSHRASLADYTVPLLDQMMSICAACCILAYGLYTVSTETVAHVGSDRLKFTVPFAVYAVFRYLFLVHKRGAGGAPEKVLLGDAPLLVDTALFLAVAGWALYV
ncbi:MAG: decaprenyl-phosphate phosphoribosyltransferase [Archangium gephyra]|uniref:Decaprenyl-phosphate phosphoribosyltransferase n=1 Tax=Archangium gephyra TaxID=48 RepID=A0A2W5VC34_9BACT|nr:MAG: decaprenyl-phosphate phosphoribosyltransferase [Archangium gephyra]